MAVCGGGEQLGTVADCSGGQCPTGMGSSRWCGWVSRRRSVVSGSGSAPSMVLEAVGGRLVWSDLSSPGRGGGPLLVIC